MKLEEEVFLMASRHKGDTIESLLTIASYVKGRTNTRIIPRPRLL